MTLEPADNTRLINILMPLPCMADSESRRGTYNRANLGRLIPYAPLNGTPVTAVPNMLQHLYQYGEIDDDETALGRLLRTLKTDVGKSDRQFFDFLIEKYHLLPSTKESPPPEPPKSPGRTTNSEPQPGSGNKPTEPQESRYTVSFTLGKIFSFTMDIQRKSIITYGLRQEFFDMDRGVVRGVEKLIERSKRIANRQGLEHSIEDVEFDFIERVNWLELWHNYVDELARQEELPCFIFNTPDRELLDFPIELARDRGECLSLTTPMYKEVIGFKRPRLYNPFQGSFPRDQQKFNLLFVASSFEGEHQKKFYDSLPLADEEVLKICQLWLKTEGPDLPPIGKILVLSNDSTVYSSLSGEKRFSVLPATAANLEQALRGDSGVSFHLFHYSGHYIYGVDEAQAGFLLYDRGHVEFFNLARLKNALVSASIHLAYLSACGSGQHREQGNFLGAAYTCLKAGVPVVIGMRWPLGDNDSRLISQYFYRNLLSNKGIPEIALWKTRTDLESQEGPNGILWAAPMMLTC